ncbi:DUF2505 domain-containing protein [Kineococcus sp. NPDC059986]|uniref:DUF2505 domain-containing protein n=1 Tax=Kineococcus sp. NPDC059986 TaxID=3155538 RepID=UPI00344C5C7B
MPTPFSEQTRFTAPPAAVHAVLVDPAFLRARAERSGALEHTEAVTADGDVLVVTSSRTVSTDVLPAAAARFLGGTAVVEQVERWEPAATDGSRRSHLTLAIKNAPVTLTASSVLAPDGAGSVHTMDGALDVRVPLLGGQVERAALPGLLQLVRSESALAQEWSAGA